MKLIEFLKRPPTKVWLAKEWLFLSRWLTCGILIYVATCLSLLLGSGLGIIKDDDGFVAECVFGASAGLWLLVYIVRLILHAVHAFRAVVSHLDQWAKKTVKDKNTPKKPTAENLPPFGKN